MPYHRTITAEPHIGTLNEGSLHAALKADYARPGDRFEVPLDGFVIDIRRPDLLIEIQTASFAAMGSKLDHLLPEHRMLLVHPIAVETYLQKPDTRPRKSPKRGSVYSLFDELVSIPTLLDHPNLTLEVVLVSLTKIQEPDARVRRGRGGFRTVDRALREIVGRHRFAASTDPARPGARRPSRRVHHRRPGPSGRHRSRPRPEDGVLPATAGALP